MWCLRLQIRFGEYVYVGYDVVMWIIHNRNHSTICHRGITTQGSKGWIPWPITNHTQTSDVADYAEADGDVYTNAHDFGGAGSLEIPQAAAPVLDAVGEIA